MTDMIQEGLDFLEEVRAAYLIASVTYTRSGNEVTVDATVGQTIARISMDNGAEMRVLMRDFLIAPAVLIVDGESIEPQLGDRIVQVEGGVTRTYEVMSPGGGEPEWRWSGTDHARYRVHTKEVETET